MQLAAQKLFHNDSPCPKSATITLAKEDVMEWGHLRQALLKSLQGGEFSVAAEKHAQFCSIFNTGLSNLRGQLLNDVLGDKKPMKKAHKGTNRQGKTRNWCYDLGQKPDPFYSSV